MIRVVAAAWCPVHIIQYIHYAPPLINSSRTLHESPRGADCPSNGLVSVVYGSSLVHFSNYYDIVAAFRCRKGHLTNTTIVCTYVAGGNSLGFSPISSGAAVILICEGSRVSPASSSFVPPLAKHYTEKSQSSGVRAESPPASYHALPRTPRTIYYCYAR